MLKLISFLLFTTLTFAQPELLLLMDGVSYEPETVAYKTRVEADGGSVISLADVDAFYVDAKANDYLDTLKCAYLITGGFKLSGTDVSVWYDLTSNDLDMIPANPGDEATYSVNGITDGTQKTDAALTVNQPYTFYTILTRSGTISGYPYVWGNGSDAIFYAVENTSTVAVNAGSEFYPTNFLLLNTPRLYTIIYNGASSSAQYNNQSATTGDAGTTNINKVYIFNNLGTAIFLIKALAITPMLSTAKSNALKAILNTLYSVY